VKAPRSGVGGEHSETWPLALVLRLYCPCRAEMAAGAAGGRGEINADIASSDWPNWSDRYTKGLA